VETLEDRSVPAGNVLATFSHGSLHLLGDAFPNDIRVEIGASPGEVTIVGNEDTTIVGTPTGTVTGSVTINLGGESDTILITGGWDNSPLTSLRIDSGTGFDTISVENVRVTTKLVVDSGQGNDSVGLQDVWARTVSINTGEGNDTVGFGGLYTVDEPQLFSVQGSLTIDTGAGNDHVGSWGATSVAGRTRITTGSGPDLVNLTGVEYDQLSPFRDLRIDTGLDEDEVYLSGIQAQATTITTGAGRDLVQFGKDDGPVQILGPLSVNTGEGNDGIVVGGLTQPPVYGENPNALTHEFFRTVTFATGNGSDVLWLANSTYYGPVKALMGAGLDEVWLGQWMGGLTLDGPVLLDLGGNNDRVRVGLPGWVESAFDDQMVPPPYGHLLGFTHLNGPVTIRGGARPATVTLFADGASFNGGLKLVGATLVERTLDCSNVVTAPKLTVLDGQTGTFTERQQHTFLTSWTISQDAAGTVSATPEFTNLWTGIGLEVAVVVAEDRLLVDLDLHFVRRTLADPVETLTIATPLGEQTIQLPVVNVLEAQSRVSVPDGGTLVLSGLYRFSESRAGTQYQGEESDLMLLVTPRIIVGEDEFGSQTVSVEVEVRLVEIADHDIFPGYDYGIFPGYD